MHANAAHSHTAHRILEYIRAAAAAAAAAKHCVVYDAAIDAMCIDLVACDVQLSCALRHWLSLDTLHRTNETNNTQMSSIAK